MIEVGCTKLRDIPDERTKRAPSNEKTSTRGCRSSELSQPRANVGCAALMATVFVTLKSGPRSQAAKLVVASAASESEASLERSMSAIVPSEITARLCDTGACDGGVAPSKRL
jgi:hypothetical protein